MKKNLTKKQITRTWIGILCSLCMVLSFVLAVPITASADEGTAIDSITIEGVDTDLNTNTALKFGTIPGDANYEIVTDPNVGGRNEEYWQKSNSLSNTITLRSSDGKLNPEQGYQYQYCITLKAKDGYYFPCNSNTGIGAGTGNYNGTISIGNLQGNPSGTGSDNFHRAYVFKETTLTIYTRWLTPTGTSDNSSTETIPSGTGTGNTSTGNETNTGTPHTHSFAWRTITEPTAEQDGLEAYACTSCGYYEESVPVSAYSYACNGGQNR